MTTPPDELTHLTDQTPQETRAMGPEHGHADNTHDDNHEAGEGRAGASVAPGDSGVTPRPREARETATSESGSDAGPAPEAGERGEDATSLTESPTPAPQNGPEGWVPDFPGQRPPFAPGNTLAVTHGASRWRPDSYFREEALVLLDEMKDPGLVPPFLQAPEYGPAMLAYATTLVRIRQVETWLSRTAWQGTPEELDGEGQVRSAALLLERYERSAARQRQELGLTPLSRARLGKDVAAGRSIADMLEERRRQRAGGHDE